MNYFLFGGVVTCYKYISSEIFERFVDNSMLRITQSFDFNDPYELSPNTTEVVDVDVLQKEQDEYNYDQRKGVVLRMVNSFSIPDEERNFMLDFILKRRIIEPLEMALSERKRNLVKSCELILPFFFNKSEDSRILSLSTDDLRLANNLGRIFLSEFGKNIYGILCCSRNGNSPLMWAHYSDNHRGVVLELDDNLLVREYKSEYVGRFHDVSYVSERPALKFSIFNHNEMMQNFIFKKSIDWKYENECRFIWPLGLADKVIDEKIKLINIPREALKSVVLGCNFDLSAGDGVVEDLRLRWPDVKVLKAKLSDELFTIEYETLE